MLAEVTYCFTIEYFVRIVAMSHHKHEHDHLESLPTEQEALQHRAYWLWEKAGRPEGQSERFWMEARERIAEVDRPVAARPH
jgi:hypothetical protein